MSVISTIFIVIFLSIGIYVQCDNTERILYALYEIKNLLPRPRPRPVEPRPVEPPQVSEQPELI